MALMLVQPSLWIVVLVLVLCGLLAMRLARQIVRPINAINPDNPNATPTYPELQPLIDPPAGAEPHHPHPAERAFHPPARV